MTEQGDLKVFNPNKEISREITLEILTRHRDCMKQARTGELPTAEVEKISDNDRKHLQVRALRLIISAQREMITISRPIIFHSSMQKWKKTQKVKTDPKYEENVEFDKHDNDYNKIIDWLGLLKACEKDILEAERTQTVKDDYIVKKDTNDGEKFELTDNFYEMLDELESSYEQIYLLMLINKIVSAGIEEDEELSYKQKEEEAVRRVVEA